MFVFQLEFCRSTFWAIFYAFLLCIGDLSLMEILSFQRWLLQEPNAAKLSSAWMTSVSHIFCSGVLEAGFESDLNFFSEQHLVPAPSWGSSFYNLMVSLMHPPQYQLIGRRSFILSTGPFPLSPSSTFSSPTFSPGPNHSVPLLELGTWPMPSTYSCWYASEKSCING